MNHTAGSLEISNADFASALARLWQSLLGNKALEEILAEILASLHSILPFDSASILLVQGGDLVFKAAVGLPNSGQLLGTCFNQREYRLTNRCLRDNTPIIIDDVRLSPEWKLRVPTAEDLLIRSWLGVPLRAGDQVIGVLCLDSFTPGYFQTMMLTPILSFAEQATLATWHAKLSLEARNRDAESHVLLEISRDLSSSLELDAVLDIISAKARHILTKDAAAVYLLDSRDNSLSVASVCGPDSEAISRGHVEPGSGIVGSVALTGQSEIINDLDADPRAQHIEGTGNDEAGDKIMVVPLIARDRILGVMVVWRSAGEADFGSHDLEFCSTLASHAALAIFNAQLYGQSRQARTEAEAANRSKTRFLATMSHELRTPLNSIINFSYLLQQGVEGHLNDGQQDMLHRIESSGRYLLSLINDILDLAKIESGRMELFIEPLDPAALVRDAASLATGLFQNKLLQFEVYANGPFPAIYADKTRLRQIMLNLLSNAVKFTDKGYVRLSARVEQHDVVFAIEDSGRGMTKLELSAAFQEFAQADPLKRGTGEGSGLGLAIVKRPVDLHRGTIQMESIPKKGTKVRFTIPLAEQSATHAKGST